MDGDKTVTANFIRQWTLTMPDPDAAGTVTPSPGPHVYDDGTVVNITFTANLGYRFVSWSGGVVDPNNPSTSMTMNANKTVTVNIVILSCLIIDVNPPEGGTTNPAPGTHYYDAGTQVIITATPAADYRFFYWTGDVADPNNAVTEVTLMTGNKTVTANFEQIQYKITITSPNGGENWQANTTHNITWNSSGTSGNVKIEYSYDNGSNWHPVIASTPDNGNGSYSWTVPNTPSQQCLVKITDTDGSPSDQSDAVFTIFPSGILGDVNDDDNANSTDALIVLSCDVGINVSPFCPMNCGDVNEDGLVNSTDALIILSYDVGISVPFPVGQPGCPQNVTPCAGCNQ
jgi:hypothetical protein